MNKLIILFALLCINCSLFAQEETKEQRDMARMMATFMDQVWESTPEEGYGNLRILMLKQGEVYAGSISAFGKFSYRLEGKSITLMSFNPNENGRFVHDEIKPGKYTLTIEGKDEMEGFKWEQVDILIESGSNSIIEVEIGE